MIRAAVVERTTADEWNIINRACSSRPERIKKPGPPPTGASSLPD